MITGKEQIRLSAYCFLAALTENGQDLYNDVYVPICKRALSYYCVHKNKNGLHTDIQQTILDLYGIRVPESIVSLLLKRIQKSFSRKESSEISLILSDKTPKSFQVKSFTFNEHEAKYKTSQRNANLIEKEFTNYAINKQEDSCPSFARFIEKYHKRLSGFFTGNGALTENDIETSYLCHARFLQEIESSNDKLYQIAEQLYLGSVVASYFENEIDLDAKFENTETYFLDTQIVLQALDLQGEYFTNPSKELLEIIKNTGGQLKVLGITYNEIEHQLDKAINRWDNKNPHNLINQSCIENKKGKDWLILLKSRLVDRLKKELDITVEIISPALKEKFRKSEDIKQLEKERFKKSAEHDVLVYLYVRHLRNRSFSSIQKAKYWFVSNNSNLYSYNKENSKEQKVSEVVLPDYLIGLLWLKNPLKHIYKIKKTGLGMLLSLTLKDEIPSQELIFNYELKVKENTSISDEDYVFLHDAVSNESAKKIEQYILEGDKRKIENKAKDLVNKAKQKQKKQTEKVSELESRLQELEKALKEKHKTEEELKHNSNKQISDIKNSELTAREQLQKENDDKLQEILRQEKIKRKRIILFFLFFVIVIACLWLIFYSPYIERVKVIFSSIGALFLIVFNIISAKSGIWSFISMIKNLFGKK